MNNFKRLIRQNIFVFFSLLFILSALMHGRIFTTDLIGVHLWRQTQTQINIQNFYRHDFNIMNPRNNSFNGGNGNIMRYEFPIMQWLIAANHKIIGESIAITRVSMFLIGLWGVLGIFFMLKYIFKDTFLAALGAWAFNFSPVFYYYTMNPLPDVFALCSTIWAIAFFFRFLNTDKWYNIFLSAVFLSLATLAKLPYIIFGSMVGAYILIEFFKNKPKSLAPLLKSTLIYSVLLLPAFAWYKWVIPAWGTNGVLKGVLDNHISLSKSLYILQFHLFTTLPKLLLNYASVPFFLVGLYFMFKNKVLKTGKGFILMAMGSSVIFYFFFEINIIETGHDYYMMPFLIPLFIIVVYCFKNLFLSTIRIQKSSFILLSLMPLVAFLSVNNYWNIEKSSFSTEILSYKDELKNAVPQNEKCILLNDNSTYIFSYLVDKQGFIFWDDNLPVGWIEDMVKNFGIKYMYSDSRKVDTQPKFQPFIDSLIMERGTVKVFKLKLPQK
jgi:4-amino-4-deoxy-L-arabinose transferase-like glycosyltransferase